MQNDFFAPQFNFILPSEFQNPPMFQNHKDEKIVWGPFVGLLINNKSLNEKQISEQFLNSDEFVLYLQRGIYNSDCLIEWWTHRQHIFEVTKEPKFEDGILKLANHQAGSRLWLRSLNEWESRPAIMSLN